MDIGVALGSGAARGLAHIPYLEAMDEMGIRPAIIAGTSIGALIGAGWAYGMTGAELREHAYGVLGSLQLIATTFWNRGMTSMTKLLAKGLSIQVDGEGVAHAFLPEGFPDDFSSLKVPFSVVATDFYSWQEVIFDTGSLRRAIAASMAIPSLFRPVGVNGSYFLDGGVTNPLPLAQLQNKCDLTVGIDVQRSPDPGLAVKEPSMFDSAIVASEIMSQRIVDAIVQSYRPEVFVRADVGPFGGGEFWRVREIIEHASNDKDNFKRALDGAMAIVELRGRRNP